MINIATKCFLKKRKERERNKKETKTEMARKTRDGQEIWRYQEGALNQIFKIGYNEEGICSM